MVQMLMYLAGIPELGDKLPQICVQLAKRDIPRPFFHSTQAQILIDDSRDIQWIEQTSNESIHDEVETAHWILVHTPQSDTPGRKTREDGIRRLRPNLKRRTSRS